MRFKDRRKVFEAEKHLINYDYSYVFEKGKKKKKTMTLERFC